MQAVRTLRLRPERLIAPARVVLAVFSLFAVWLDPTEPVKYASMAYGLLVAYVIYAAGVAALVWRVEAVSPRWPIATHALDLAFFSLFIFLTSGPGSPFSVYFVFALMCGTLRWQVKGTVVTAAVTLTVFLSFGLYFGMFAHDADFDLRAFIIRGVYLFVIAILLGYIGVHEQRLLRDMWLLASWPDTTNSDLETLTRTLLGYAEPLLDAPSAVLAWSEHNGRWTRLGIWRQGQWSFTRQPAGVPLVHPDLDDRAFIRVAPSGRTLVRAGHDPLALQPWAGEPLPEVGRRFDHRTALSVPVTGECVKGRLFLFDKADIAADDLMIAEIMASVVAGRLDAFYLDQQLQQSAATEERIRLARDLHDGVLQSFTGVALRLAAIRSMLDQQRPGVTAEIEQLQRVLAAEQRELRFFIQDLKPSPGDIAVGLEPRLRSLVARVEHEWDLDVELHVDVPGGLPAPFCRDIYHIVREALVNAARHGLASRATVRVQTDRAARVSLSIEDDGRGFSFTGQYSATELADLGVGPKTLRERVQALNGSLTLESSPEGAVLHIVLPAVAA